MGTRATFIFEDDTEKYQVYSHWDGYPTEAVNKIKDAMSFAWDLPRYEASDFAAAFIAGNKPKGGGSIRAMNYGNKNDWAEYVYVISGSGDPISSHVFLTAYEGNSVETGIKLFSCSFPEMDKAILNYEKSLEE